MRKYFGTDGVRGLVGDYPITAEFAQKLGNAVGSCIVSNQEKRLVVIGQDTRGSGDFIKHAMISGLLAAGIDVMDLGILPTPLVAFMTLNKKASAGVVITASHNKFTDNGIKLFSSQALKLSDSTELAIENEIDKEFYYDADSNFGNYIKLDNVAQEYIKEKIKLFSPHIDYKGDVVVDCANGAGSNIFENLLDRLNINFKSIASEPNGTNINNNCGATYIENISNAVLHHKADIGISLDGDGDRIMLVDENGKLVDGDAILYILSKYPKIVGNSDGVVGTLMTNMSYQNAYKDDQKDFIRANVGDKYVMQAMFDNNYKIGGESSGHIINLNYGTTGDGLLTALQILAILSDTKMKLSELINLDLMKQEMINVPLSKKVNADDMSKLQDDVKFTESVLTDNGRVLLRASGTEPVMRVMVEAKTKEMAQKHAQALSEVVKQKLG